MNEIQSNSQAVPTWPQPSETEVSYDSFLGSLSESERNKFFEFVRRQIKDFSHPIRDLEAWLASKNKAGQNRWQVYYSQFLTLENQPTVNHLQKWRDELEERRKLAEIVSKQQQQLKKTAVSDGGVT